MHRKPLTGAVALATAASLLAAPSALAAPPTPSGTSGPPGIVRHHGGHWHEDQRLPGRIDVEGTVNLRDVGGYRTYFNARVKSGMIYRSDALNHLTEAGIEKLTELGIERVVDYRTPLEVRTDGADLLPAGLRVTKRPVSNNGMFTDINAAIASKDPEKQREVLGDGRGAEIMKSFYRSLITNPESEAAIGLTLREMADPSMTPMIFHCTSGKDRTGWTSYLLLRALGVPHRTAMYDFLLSNKYRAEHDAAVRERLKKTGYMQDPSLLTPMQEVRPEYLYAALVEVRREYRSVEHYLRKGLGIDGRTRAMLRRNLLTR